ncbi:hypothetical protein [Actinomycetospora soli]|uniref:hypothetical protein n=1 Tax=Actinomycetospora soli TaxID=2893887 RepID=UPI001E56E956|nr:hypothetical protein [Actinomycetospora soli]MCD2189633.1 hypothetical protein [Actinomycetospora soli]
MTGNRFGLTAALAGIAALGGAGTLAAVAPSAGSTAVRHVVVAESTTSGLLAAGTTGTSTARARGTASVPGAGPFPHTGAPITSGLFDL